MTHLCFHPGVIHLFDEVIRHLQGLPLLLRIGTSTCKSPMEQHLIPGCTHHPFHRTPINISFLCYVTCGRDSSFKGQEFFFLPFQTKIFPLAPLSKMKQSSRTNRSLANGLFSDTLVIVIEPVASDTCEEHG